MYFIQHCFIRPPLDSSVSEDAGFEPRTVATLALAVWGSNHSAGLKINFEKFIDVTDPDLGPSILFTDELYGFACWTFNKY